MSTTTSTSADHGGISSLDKRLAQIWSVGDCPRERGSKGGHPDSYQQKGDRGRVLGESDEFRRLRRATDKAKAHGDRDQAIRNVCRLYCVKAIDALPSAIRATTLALLDA